MTRDEVIKTANDIGINKFLNTNSHIIGNFLENFAKRIAEVEREACAEVCNSIFTSARKDWKVKYNPHDDGRCHGAFECEEAIRARGQE
jgi:hypothetical protein